MPFLKPYIGAISGFVFGALALTFLCRMRAEVVPTQLEAQGAKPGIMDKKTVIKWFRKEQKLYSFSSCKLFC